MSLLLDALNKADQERKRGGENPNISSNHDAQVSYAPASSSPLLKLVVGGVFLVLLLAGVYWLGQKNQLPATAPSATTSSAQAAIEAPHNDSQNTGSTVVIGDNNELPTQPPQRDNLAAGDDENIASLYQHQARDTMPIPRTGAVESGNNAETIIETPASTAVPATINTPASAAAISPMSINNFANLPDIQDLPNSVLQRIPSLKYSEHNYNSNGGSVVINGVVRHANDQLVEGLVIDKILEDGVILHFENYSFKMRALNTWVNM